MPMHIQDHKIAVFGLGAFGFGFGAFVLYQAARLLGKVEDSVQSRGAPEGAWCPAKDNPNTPVERVEDASD